VLWEPPVFVEETGLEQLFIQRVGGRYGNLVAYFENRPISQTWEQKVIQPIQLRFVEGVAAVNDDVFSPSADRQWTWTNENGRMV
jgi:hypothetical protein